MDAADRARLAEQLPKLLEFLAVAARGERPPGEIEDEYRWLHTEVRDLLKTANLECVCPWPNIYGWVGTAAASEDWEALLARLAAKAKLVAGLEKAPPWTLADYFRGGDRDDTPYWHDFVSSLEETRQAILTTSLNRELAYRGAHITDPTKLHKMPCSDKPGNRTSVWMYKIRQGSGEGEVALRVFFVTDGDFRIVVLHGYDKGADPDPVRERHEADVACARRLDYLSQDPVRRRA